MTTRFASLWLFTALALAGCRAAPGPPPPDTHPAALVGTWRLTDEPSEKNAAKREAFRRLLEKLQYTLNLEKDGRCLRSSGGPGKLGRWDAQNGRLVIVFGPTPEAPTQREAREDYAFSIEDDGKTLRLLDGEVERVYTRQ